MKILTISTSLGLGGSERAAVNYAIGYKQLGQDSRFLVIYGKSLRSSDLDYAGIISYVYWEHQEVIQEIMEWEPDVIHFHRSMEVDPYIKNIINNIKRASTLVVETNIFSRFDYSAWYRSQVDISFQLSNWCLWKYKKWQGWRSRPSSAVLPYAVNPKNLKKASSEEIAAFKKSLGIPNEAKVIGRLGQNIDAKWSPLLIDIFDELTISNPNVYMILVRPSPSVVSALERLSLNKRQQIRVIDKIEGDANLSLFYSSLDVFAHIAEIGESFGFVLTEAMLCECPIVTMATPYKDNSQLEVVGHKIGGLVANNKATFLKYIRLMLNDSTFYNSVVPNLRSWTLSRFHLTVVCDMAINILKAGVELKSKGEFNKRIFNHHTKIAIKSIYQVLELAEINLSLFQILKLQIIHNALIYQMYRCWQRFKQLQN